MQNGGTHSDVVPGDSLHVNACLVLPPLAGVIDGSLILEFEPMKEPRQVGIARDKCAC